MNAKQSKDVGTLYPFLATGNENELFCYHAQTQQSREGNKGNEAHHLAKHLYIAPHVVGHMCQGGLRYRCKHAVDGASRHVVPLTRRTIYASLLVAKAFAEQNAEGMIVEDVEYVCNK